MDADLENYFHSLQLASYLDDKSSNDLKKIISSYIKVQSEELAKKDKKNPLAKEINEFLSLRDLLPLNSYDSINEINQSIYELEQKYQSELFDAECFFNIYFNQNIQENQFEYKGVSETDLPGFKSWFKGSKAIDGNGNPQIFFHGTRFDYFTRFKFETFPGNYFAANRDYSDYFRKLAGQEGTMFTCYLRVLNPIDLSLFGTQKVKYEELLAYIDLQYGYQLPENLMAKKASDQRDGLWVWQYLRSSPSWLKVIRDGGVFDGIYFVENNPDDKVKGKDRETPAFLVFFENQIKNSVGNLTYSLDSKDIRFEKGGKLENC